MLLHAAGQCKGAFHGGRSCRSNHRPVGPSDTAGGCLDSSGTGVHTSTLERGRVAVDRRRDAIVIQERQGVEDFSNRWALVTGASSGFGVQFAQLLAERKANLVMVARSKEPMEALAKELRHSHAVQVVVESMDLSRTGAAA